MSIREEVSSGREDLNYRPAISPYLKPRSYAGDQVRADSLEEISKRLAMSLARIIRTFDCDRSPEYFPGVITMLEALPLSTSEFGLAKSRLKNARRYADSQEPGAAIYELRMLLRWLRNWD